MNIKIVKNENFIYKVCKEENVKDIANKFKLSEGILIKENSLNSSILEEGDVIFVNSENKYFYTVKPLDTINHIAKKFNVTTIYIKEKNNLLSNHLFIGQILII